MEFFKIILKLCMLRGNFEFMHNQLIAGAANSRCQNDGTNEQTIFDDVTEETPFFSFSSLGF